MALLEKKVPQSSPNTIDACVIDGQFLLHTLPPNIPGNYGGLAASMLMQMTSLSRKRVHIVFDAYTHPSIKESERVQRGLDEREYIITGPEQHRPKTMADLLNCRSFKEQLPQFLATEWESPQYAHIIKDREVYIAFLGSCFRFHVSDGNVIKENVIELACNHEEADTMICAHVKHIDNVNVQNIIIRASETDIAVITTAGSLWPMFGWMLGYRAEMTEDM